MARISAARENLVGPEIESGGCFTLVRPNRSFRGSFLSLAQKANSNFLLEGYMTELPGAQDCLSTAADAGSARLGSQADQAGDDNGWEKDAQGG